MGLEPTNLLTASQALYQLSYAPSGGGSTLAVGGTRPSPGSEGAGESRIGRPAGPRGRLHTAQNRTRVSPTLVGWHARTTSMRWSANGSATGTTRALTRSTTTTPGRSSTRCACTPTPPGPAHQGHVRNYTFGDLIVRYQTMQGKGVLSPIGFDSFGLPAENAAIKTGTHPRIFTEARIAELKASLRRLGAVYDWRREMRSHDPAYIKWNQFIFLRFWEAGLAYRALAPVNWCPGCQTVLANEQVLPDGTCERSGDVVERRDLEQWFFRITQYADELLDALDDLEWPERAKTMQRNWIGRSEGAEFDLPSRVDPTSTVRVFTTRPDTSFGMTYAVMAPEHPLVDELTTDGQRAEVDAVATRAAAATDIERMTEGDRALGKRGAFTGSQRHQPVHQQPVPIYVADYVLMGYGTGAIMAVPGRGRADLAFATHTSCRSCAPCSRPRIGRRRGRGLHGRRRQDQQRLPRRPRHRHGEGAGHRVARGPRHRRAQGQVPAARLAGSAPALLGLPDPGRVLPDHGVVPVPEDQLPVVAPDDVEFLPTGQSPLAPTRASSTRLPDLRRSGAARDRHHGHVRRLVVVLPAFLRSVEHRAAVRARAAQHFMPVDQYIGGINHAILHLLYARFYTRALVDIGLGPARPRAVPALFARG